MREEIEQKRRENEEERKRLDKEKQEIEKKKENGRQKMEEKKELMERQEMERKKSKESSSSQAVQSGSVPAIGPMNQFDCGSEESERGGDPGPVRPAHLPEEGGAG